MMDLFVCIKHIICRYNSFHIGTVWFSSYNSTICTTPIDISFMLENNKFILGIFYVYRHIKYISYIP